MKYENVVFPDGIGFRCRNCGKCCREQPADVTIEEQKLIDERGHTDYLEAPDGTGSRWIKRKSDGSCFFLTTDNKCSIYDIQPEICKIVPFFVTDFDYENSSIQVDLCPETDCPGLFVGQEIPLEKMGKAAQELTKEMIEIVANQLKLPKTDKKVLSTTRITLMGMLSDYGKHHQERF